MHLLIPHPLHLKLHRLRVTKGLWIPPSDPNAPIAFIEEVDDKDAFVKPLRPEPIGHSTVQHVDDPDPFDEPSTHDRPCPSATGKDPVDVLSPIPMMILYLLSVTLNTSSSAKTCRPLSV